MVLSKRERYVVIGTVIAVSALALDRFGITPLLRRRSETEVRKERLLSELRQARALLEHRQQFASKWQEMVKAGLQSDPVAAESQVLHAIRDWAEESGVALLLLKPSRMTSKGRLHEIAFQATGNGNMRAITRLLWRIQTASIPIRITKLQLSARQEGKDDLLAELYLSTIHMPAQSTPAATTSPSDRSGGDK